MDIKRAIEQAIHSYGLRNVKKTGPLCYWYWADDDFIDSEPFKAMEEYASEYGEGVFFGGSVEEQTKVEQLVGIDWGFDGVAIKIVDPLAQMIDSYLDEYGYDTMATKYAQSKNESRHVRGRMLREGRRPVRRGRFLTEDRIRKSKPIAVIQGNYGYGWDDESSYDMDDVGYLKSIKHDFDEYRKSGHNALYRIVHKRQKLDKPQKFVKGEWLDVEDEPVKAEACGKRKKGKKVIKEDADMNNKDALAFFDDIEEHLRNSYEDGDDIDDIIEMCLDDREDEIRSNLKALATWYDVEVGEDLEDTFDEVREFVRDTLRSEADDWFDLDGED